ncbi:sigma factor G inhibitor Gin [Salirhabdus salicampi]|uniref:sigma factor G inhibitor Gin n=1 Tax=Salirhabdus salicampi TaxID=476102 RepID=UPI0020C488C1|nr:sigma factor G inhibitor Gin [Salirhabdus salicampi]MCP8618149.1 sigma factor G inhibitor Gin [Salirhabdus salicampi]
MKNERYLNHCSVCNETKLEGITIYNMFICISCEQEIVKTEPEDEKYKFFIHKLKGINQKKQYS